MSLDLSELEPRRRFRLTRILFVIELALFVAGGFADRFGITAQLAIQTLLLVYTVAILPHAFVEELSSDLMVLAKTKAYLISLLAFPVWVLPISIALLYPQTALPFIQVSGGITVDVAGRLILLLSFGVFAGLFIFYRVARKYIIEQLGIEEDHGRMLLEYTLVRSEMPTVLISITLVYAVNGLQLSLLPGYDQIYYADYWILLSIVLVAYVLLFVWYVPERLDGCKRRAAHYLPTIAIILALLVPATGVLLICLSIVGLILMTRLSPEFTLQDMFVQLRMRRADAEKRRLSYHEVYDEHPLQVLLGTGAVFACIILGMYVYFVGLLDVISSVLLAIIPFILYTLFERWLSNRKGTSHQESL